MFLQFICSIDTPLCITLCGERSQNLKKSKVLIKKNVYTQHYDTHLSLLLLLISLDLNKTFFLLFSTSHSTEIPITVSIILPQGQCKRVNTCQKIAFTSDCLCFFFPFWFIISFWALFVPEEPISAFFTMFVQHSQHILFCSTELINPYLNINTQT